MKKIILLLTSLMLISACSTSTNKYATYRIDDPIFISYQTIADDKNFKASGLSDSDKVTKYKDSTIYRSHSPSFYNPRNEDGSLQYYVLDSYQAMQEFDQSLKDAIEEKGYVSEHIYTQLFASLKEEDFNNHELIVIRDIELGSGSNGYKFKDLYLKDDTLYAYMMFSDYNNFPGRSGTCDMVWIGLSLFVEKDVDYSSFRLLVDDYLPKYN